MRTSTTIKTISIISIAVLAERGTGYGFNGKDQPCVLHIEDRLD